MSTLTTVEKARFHELFGMDSGYVLDFSNRTFAEFFRDNAKVDIDAAKYTKDGNSKAKRLRAFWEIENDALVARVLSALLEYWSHKNPQPSATDATKAVTCQRVVGRLLDTETARKDSEEQSPVADVDRISLANIKIDSSLRTVLEARYSEAIRCLDSDAPLAAIILSGSILEGLLLGLATTNPREFNQAPSCPRDPQGKPRPFREWSLAQFIDVACDLGHLTLDVKKFSHCVRDFRNFIHPHEQLRTGFSPDLHTARICLQVLNMGIACLSGQRS